ncbi:MULTISPECIES: nuclear transport factor 2 family protein [unclassified Rhizobium]|uniref:nuclear transport factor 2 family protein n=1 Tax=unclassified Rhizobium TaxID=2613769 RepID=UPI0016070D9D|nr:MULTISPECIES: nuclear transport factor 2 family protein [unclassified Rhizobium]MBB3543616.1 ketosteroid isomerase-like protein [Rhizobium sp. BK399]MCS3741856.1 ketosteroid isomerase-like protein [Rhizobium sp. BK661]MCS4095435.1 ketosteroid isomerase-like protein [Rhizobium sp. BK176]
MTSGADLKDLTRQIFEARHQGDLDVLMSFLGDNCIFRAAGSRYLAPLTEPVVGSAALRATMRHFIDTWDMTALEILDIHVDGNVALVHRRGQMPHGTTKFDTEVMDKMTFENGKVIECVEFLDTLQAASLLNIATISAAQI